MTPTDRARILFSEARHSRTPEDVARFCGCTDDEARAAISELHAEGFIRTTGHRSYIPSTVKRRHFADGTARRVTDYEADTAAILAMLPERTIAIANHVDRSVSHVIKLLNRAGAVSDARNVWHPPGTTVLRRSAQVITSDLGPDEGGIIAGGSDVSTWVEVGPTREGFDCERRGQFVTLAQCLDDYTTAAAGCRVSVSACHRCAIGQKQRVEYARGGW